MTAEPDAFDIASQFFDSRKKRNDLELAILRHMEHHVALEREACAKLVHDRLGADGHGVAQMIRARRHKE